MRPGHEKADKGGFRLRRQDRGGDEGDREQLAQNGDVIHRVVGTDANRFQRACGHLP